MSSPVKRYDMHFTSAEFNLLRTCFEMNVGDRYMRDELMPEMLEIHPIQMERLWKKVESKIQNTSYRISQYETE